MCSLSSSKNKGGYAKKFQNSHALVDISTSPFKALCWYSLLLWNEREALVCVDVRDDLGMCYDKLDK